jgi:hypothetical protein
MRQRSGIALAAGILAVSSVAYADVQYTVEAGAGHSDNMTRVPDGEVDETIATAGLDLTWNEVRPRLTAEANVNARYFDYLDDTYDSEVVGTADAMLLFGLVPERFTWLVQDSFGQERSDPFAPVTPDTREDVNFFTTGPNVTFRLGSSGVLRLLGRYSASQFERSPLDGDRVGGGFALVRQPSTRSEISLNAFSEQVRFEEEFNNEYDRNSVYLGYSAQGARTDITVEAGYTMLEMENGDEQDSPLLDVEVSRELSPGSTLALAFGTELTDSSDALRSAVDGAPVEGSAGAVASADPYKNRFASLGWNFARRRTTLNLRGRWDEDSYETQTTLDRTSLIWSASIDRQIAPALSVGLAGSLSDEEFDNSGLSADELRYGVTLNWQVARTLALRLVAERFDRDSSDAAGEYVENRIFLTLLFRPAGSRSSAPAATP